MRHRCSRACKRPSRRRAGRRGVPRHARVRSAHASHRCCARPASAASRWWRRPQLVSGTGKPAEDAGARRHRLSHRTVDRAWRVGPAFGGERGVATQDRARSGGAPVRLRLRRVADHRVSRKARAGSATARCRAPPARCAWIRSATSCTRRRGRRSVAARRCRWRMRPRALTRPRSIAARAVPPSRPPRSRICKRRGCSCSRATR